MITKDHLNTKHNIKLTKDVGVRPINAQFFMKRNFYSEQEIKFLKDNYSDMKTADIAAIMNRPLGSVNGKAYELKLKKSFKHMKALLEIEAEKLRSSGIRHQFKKGQPSHNKGKKMPAELYEKVKRTMFKPGHKPGNTKKVGAIRIDHEGYTYVKLADSDWVLKHRHVWEQVNGPVPANHVVIFKDNNMHNFDINNLQVISQADNMLRNTIHQYPEQIQELIKLKNKLKKKINEKQN